MKTPTYILIFLLALPLLSNAQNDSIVTNKETPNFNNQIDLDIEVLAFSFGYKHRISKNWLVGFNIGIGPVASLGYVNNKYDEPYNGLFYTELHHLGIVAKTYNKTNKWSFEIDTRLALLLFGGDDGGALIIRIGSGIYYGRKIQIGVRTAIGKMYGTDNIFFISNNLIVRIPLKW